MIPTKYLVIHVDGTLEERSVDWPPEPSLMQFKQLIDPIVGGELEHVRVLFGGQATDMFVDESGIQKGVSRNEQATVIYRNNMLTREPDTDPESLPAVYGTAVLFFNRVWF